MYNQLVKTKPMVPLESLRNTLHPEKTQFDPHVQDVDLLPQEVAQIDRLISDLLKEQPLPDDTFLDMAAVASQELPLRLRQEIYYFRRYQPYPGIRIRLFPIDDSVIDPTPSDYRGESGKQIPVMREQALHAMFASQLGEPIAWTSQQNGLFFNDIIPIQANEEKAISSGSKNLFGLHTEDAALYPHTPDYLGLMGLRNHDRIPTIASTIDWSVFDPQVKEVLFQPRFIIGVNAAHTLDQPQKPTPLLHGNSEFPYMRINLNLQQAAPGDEEAQHALDLVAAELNRNAMDVVVEQGSYFYLDNNIAAHGRGPYQPRYDGTDRWLQRLTIISNPRAFQDIAVAHGSRVFDPTLISR